MRTSGLGKFALGQAMPNRDHAVCVSLPTVQDLIGYEEKKPETVSAINSGYPRFVQHRLIKQVIKLQEESLQTTGMQSFLFSDSNHCKEALKRYSIKQPLIQEYENYTCLQVPESSEEALQINSFLQHTGGTISSRHAEDILFKNGYKLGRESLAEHDNPLQFAKEIIAQVHGNDVSSNGVLFASSGANAFFSLFSAAYDRFLPKGKNLWIRLGWLYLDTIETMKLIAKEEDILTLHDPTDRSGLQELFSKYGNKIAGVVTEFPTNPLLQSCDLEYVRELCDRVNAMLIIDPTMASPKNSKVAELGDVIVNSLTKYASWEGDLMIGSLVFPDKSKIGRSLFESIEKNICPPFHRDLLRLCEQLPYYSSFVEKTNRSLLQVADFLQRSDAIKKVYWAYQPGSAMHFRQRAGEDKPGCVISFELKGNFESFYNSLSMLKSPSFGTEFSICCPYVYLAHYRMIKTEKGRYALKKAGISPQLCRLSVGLEETDDIIQTLQDAL